MRHFKRHDNFLVLQLGKKNHGSEVISLQFQDYLLICKSTLVTIFWRAIHFDKNFPFISLKFKSYSQ